MDYDNTKDSELSPRKQTYEIRKNIPKGLQELAYSNADVSEWTGKYDASTHFKALDVFGENKIAVIFAGGCTKEKLISVLDIPAGVFNEWMCATDERRRRLKKAMAFKSIDKAEDVIDDGMTVTKLDQEEKAGWDVKLKAAAMVKKDNEVPEPKEENKNPTFIINVGGTANFDNAKVYEDGS